MNTINYNYKKKHLICGFSSFLPPNLRVFCFSVFVEPTVDSPCDTVGFWIHLLLGCI